jgi:hypothetical protein
MTKCCVHLYSKCLNTSQGINFAEFFFMISLSSSRQNASVLLELGHGHFFTNPFYNFLCMCQPAKKFNQVRGFMQIFVTSLFFYGEEFLAPRPTPGRRNTPCQLSVTAYSVYSQLPSISVGRLFHPQPEDAPCRGDKGPNLRPVEGSCEDGNEHSGSVKCCEVLE